MGQLSYRVHKLHGHNENDINNVIKDKIVLYLNQIPDGTLF